MEHVRLAGGAQLAAVMLEAELPGAADDLGIVRRAVGANGSDQEVETGISDSAGVRIELGVACVRG